jgi:putative PIN family toxin of toxin-antitoxin system
MEILVDSNILVSAILFPNSAVARVFDFILEEHTPVLCDYITKEVESVFLEKFPRKIKEMKKFIAELEYKRFDFGEINTSIYPNIRDVNDFPILVAAIESNADILITGDKDFDEVSIDKPRIMNPRKFADEYMNLKNGDRPAENNS